MDGLRLDRNHLMIKAKNIPQFYKLLTKTKKEAQQLNDTIGKLSCFEFNIEFTAESGQAGDMESASSEIRNMPTK